MISIDRRVVVGASAGLMALAVACGSDDNLTSQSDLTAVPGATNPTAVPTVGPDDGGAEATPSRTADGAVFNWQVETVDEGAKPAIALASDGTPYVAYMREAISGFVKAASRTGDQWNIDTIVIPHGTSWGFYTPPGTTLDKQLTATANDPRTQLLIEVYSGHGNSEEYREWRAVAYDDAGHASCPEPTPDYLPCCWRAGEIIRSRCEDPTSAECDRRAQEARRGYVAAGVSGHLTVSGSTV